jgi:hypothetical protein
MTAKKKATKPMTLQQYYTKLRRSGQTKANCLAGKKVKVLRQAGGHNYGPTGTTFRIASNYVIGGTSNRYTITYALGGDEYGGSGVGNTITMSDLAVINYDAKEDIEDALVEVEEKLEGLNKKKLILEEKMVFMNELKLKRFVEEKFLSWKLAKIMESEDSVADKTTAINLLYTVRT